MVDGWCLLASCLLALLASLLARVGTPVWSSASMLGGCLRLGEGGEEVEARPAYM